MLLNPFEFHKPESLKDAGDLYFRLPDAKLLAGGTFLINTLKAAKRNGLKTPAHIISLKRLPELAWMSIQDGRVHLGAGLSLNEVLGAALTPSAGALSLLKMICRGVGTSQIRNMGTLGGNAACRYPWAEIPSGLICLEATLSFYTAAGESMSFSAEDFYQNGARTKDILTHISFPLLRDCAFAYSRVSKTQDLDIPLCAVSARARITGGVFTDPRIVFNRGSLFPYRCLPLEQLIDGKPVIRETIVSAVETVRPHDFDTHADDYKSHMYTIAVRDALTALTAYRAQP